MGLRPPVIRDQDRIDVRLTSEAEYRIPFTFIEALNEGTLFDRPAQAFLEAARERRLFHVLNQTTDNIIGTGIIQGSGDEKSTKKAEVGGLMFHPAARGFGLCSLLVKIMMVYATRTANRNRSTLQNLTTDCPDRSKFSASTNRLGDLCKKTRNSPIRAIGVIRGSPDP
jgi:hypothetical protein